MLEHLGPVHQALLSQVISSLNVAKFRDNLSGHSPDEHLCSLVLHRRVEPDFETTFMQMASPWVTEKVASHLFSMERERFPGFTKAAVYAAGP